jgi:hypothetical protein
VRKDTGQAPHVIHGFGTQCRCFAVSARIEHFADPRFPDEDSGLLSALF